MLEILRNAWKIQDLRKKILYTLMMLLIFRLGSFIPIPGVNVAALGEIIKTNGLLQMFDLFSGGAMANFTIFAAGISPYITASIVIQLLAVAIPSLEALQKEGEQGRRKLNQYTRILGVAMAFVTALGMALTYGTSLLVNPAWYNFIYVAVIATAGSALAMWIGERITENGIGNGISLLIFINIISRIPTELHALYQNMFVNGTTSPWLLPVVIVAFAAIIVAVVLIDLGQRRIPVQYAKKMVGRKMYGGQSSNLPIKVNMVGVMPIIFANSIITIPSTIAMFCPTPAEGSFWAGFLGLFQADSWFYAILTLVLIVAFAYFYISISFNPIEVANNMKANGGFIPGIRPGRPTSEYITKILSRVTFIGALCLGVVAVLPVIANIVSRGALSGFAFGGSSIIIVCGVVLETIREVEAQMTMRHYKGFLE